MLLLSVWKVEEGERARGKPDILARRKRKRGKNEGGGTLGNLIPVWIDLCSFVCVESLDASMLL